MIRPSRSSCRSGQGVLPALFLLILTGCPPWSDEDLAAVGDRVSYVDAMVGGPSCGLAESGEIYCWGQGGDQLGSIRPADQCFQASNIGNGHDELCSKRPVPVFSDEKFVQLAGGQSHTCAVTEEGEVFCWGNNSYGQIALSPTERISVGGPLQIEGLPEIAMVALNASQSCAVTRAGAIWCWGAPGPIAAGGMGFPAASDHVPAFVVGSPTAYVEVALGETYGCARTAAGEVDCWGESLRKKTGITQGPACIEDNQTCLLPVRMETETRFSKIVGGNTRICGLAQPGGDVWCWGFGAPQLARPGSHVALAVYDGQLCTVSSENFVSCDGDGISSGGDPSWPKLETISVNYWNACGTSLDGDVYCWGSNNVGQLGDGTTEGSLTPVKVSNPYAY